MTALPAFGGSRIESVLATLPPLPSALRYWDDYLDTHHVIRNLTDADVWTVKTDGRHISIHFTFIPLIYRFLAKHVVAEMLSRLESVLKDGRSTLKVSGIDSKC